MPLLQVLDLEKSFGGKKVVNGLSFHVNKGEIVALIGPNGAGKTTSFYMTVGLISPDRGHVIFNGKEVTKKPIHERAQMGMGYLAQEPSIFRGLTVEENILCILETLPIDKAEQRERLHELLGELRLSHLAKKKAVSLSGGERRRLEITRALVTNPTFLLLDEPFANIDPITVNDVKEMIRHLRQKGITILITDHNAREILTLVDRSYLIYDGRVSTSGTADELMESEKARHTYLGADFKL